MLHRMKKISISLLLAGAMSMPALADIGFISSHKAKLYSDPSFKSNVVALASKGQEVTLKQLSGAWVLIRFAQKEGWVSKYLVKRTPPSEKIRLIGSDEKFELIDIRRRSSAISTAAAARGLSKTIRVDDADKNRVDRKAVHYMESFSISDSDLKIFVEKIGAENG